MQPIWRFQIVQFSLCETRIQTCAQYVQEFSYTMVALSSNMYTVLYNFTSQTCHTGLTEINNTNSANYFYVPKGAIIIISSSLFPKMALKTDASVADYTFENNVLKSINEVTYASAIYMGIYAFLLSSSKWNILNKCSE